MKKYKSSALGKLVPDENRTLVRLKFFRVFSASYFQVLSLPEWAKVNVQDLVFICLKVMICSRFLLTSLSRQSHSNCSVK